MWRDTLQQIKDFLGFGDPEQWRNIVASLFLLLAMLLLRVGVSRALLSIESVPAEQRRRWMVTLRNVAFFLFGFGLLIIWAEQVRTWAISLVAIAAALVLATKELILCASGAVLRTLSRPFSVGDRIEINGVRGDVIDMTLLTTSILEIGPGIQNHLRTGRAITLPNSLLLSFPAINESYLDDFVLHVFSVPLLQDDEWEEAEKMLLVAAQDECASFLAEAKEKNKELARTQGFDTPSMEPRVTVRIPAANQIELVVRIPCPSRQKGALEQAILRCYLKSMKAQRPKSPQ
jgi:small-conductance mechanosensitive channel